MPDSEATETMRWVGDANGHLRLIDQTRLPAELVHLDCRDADTVWEAIKMLRVRGAPAIGIAAAYGLCIGLQAEVDKGEDEFFEKLNSVADYLAGSRPTAVNLFWALDRMRSCAARHRAGRSPVEIFEQLLGEARAIHEEDRAICRRIGQFGSELFEDGQGVLTHCNAGGLATAEYGTALSVFFTAQDRGIDLHVYVDETRPLLQGARLTAWELARRNIQATLICDSMAAQVMKEGRVHAVVTGADRIASNGDAANKIGTYSVAVLAHAHHIPFYVAAPISTFDLTIDSGDEIPIEQRDAREITHGFGKRTAPDDVSVYNPAFDVTPAHLIRAIITERGLIQPVNKNEISRIAGDS